MCKKQNYLLFFAWIVSKFVIIHHKFLVGISMKDKINTHFDYNEKIKKCKTIDDVMGKNRLIQRLVKYVLENILEAETEENLWRNKYKHTKNEHSIKKNYRNGYSIKNLRSSFCEVYLDIPRDRNSEFEPQII